MLVDIIEWVNENTPYSMTYYPSDKTMIIRTDKGIPVKDYIKIRRAIRPWVNNVIVKSRWS